MDIYKSSEKLLRTASGQNDPTWQVVAAAASYPEKRLTPGTLDSYWIFMDIYKYQRQSRNMAAFPARTSAFLGGGDRSHSLSSSLRQVFLIFVNINEYLAERQVHIGGGELIDI